VSAECSIHECHLVGYMEDAFCPLCELERLREAVQAALGELDAPSPGSLRDVPAVRNDVGSRRS
jgi:hypothetical protein